MLSGKILICEDEKDIVSFLRAELLHAGFEADAAYDGETALKLFAENEYDLALVDLMLPRRNGLEVLRGIREAGDTPVIIITARKDTFDKVLLLKSGADDYVTKPFDVLELLARIERGVGRARGAGAERAVRELRGLRADYAGFTASVDGTPVPLTKTEFEILFCLLKNAGRVMDRDGILRRVYGDYFGDSNVVDVNIKNIRRKLAALSADTYIETVRGKGYVAR
jgi:two-component system response regulator ArlR